MVLCVYFMTGAPEGSTESISGEARDRTCSPWFTRHSTYPHHDSPLKLFVEILNTIGECNS